MIDKKKLAAISAVIAIINSEKPKEESYEAHSLPTPAWTLWGRQQTMQYRDIVQRRIIKKNK